MPALPPPAPQPPTSLLREFLRGLGGNAAAMARARRRTYDIIEAGDHSDRASHWFNVFIVCLILANVVALMLETVKNVQAVWGRYFFWFEVVSVVIFLLEYVARLWTAVEVPFLARLGPLQARMTAAKRPSSIIDLLSVIPSLMELAGGLAGLDLRVLRVFRLMRFFKLSRYSPAMHTIVRVLANERRSLGGAGLLLIAVLLVSSTVMYYLEHEAQPDKFSSIPAATYWAMTTLTTVGYGDLVPETPLGKFWAMVTMLMGLCTLALPVAIISTAFAQEAGRRDFVVSWAMMSRIPLFADLSNTEVAELMTLLHASTLPPLTEVIPEGSPGDAMYFVASGRVQATYGETVRTYEQGDYFGSVAMMNNDLSAGTYTSLGRCRLLKLHRADFARLERVSPNVGRHIRLTAEKRQKERAEQAAMEATAARENGT